MSRTYRRKSGDPSYKRWHTSSSVRIDPDGWCWMWVPMDPASNEYKRAVARYHSDRTNNFKEPGPSWFRKLYTERPQRREAKRQLKKYMSDPDFEVILNAKDPLEYWT